MPSRSYVDSAKLLKSGALAPCYYFHGPVDLLKDEALAGLLERSLDPSMRDLNYDQRSATQLAPDDIEALCNTLPMMSERRVVVVRDVEAWGRKAKAKRLEGDGGASRLELGVDLLLSGPLDQDQDGFRRPHADDVRDPPGGRRHGEGVSRQGRARPLPGAQRV